MAVVSRRPALGLAAVVVAAFAAYVALGAAVDAPRAFSDELLYVETGTSIAEGDGLTVRGQPYELYLKCGFVIVGVVPEVRLNTRTVAVGTPPAVTSMSALPSPERPMAGRRSAMDCVCPGASV